METQVQHNVDSIKEWHRNSSVRNLPRRILAGPSNQSFFPISRQPLVIHPLVFEKDENIVHHILTQTAYYYLYEIAMIETESVNNVALRIAKNELFEVEQDYRIQAFEVIVDEAYHAYVALDAIKQIEALTNIKPNFLENLDPIQRTLSDIYIPSEFTHYNHLLFVSVCLSEHVLTKDLVHLKKEPNVSEFFNQIMSDHLIDEGRHASYFSKMLELFWQQAAPEQKKDIIDFLPKFINSYTDNSSKKIFEEKLLLSLQFSENEIKEIFYDTYYEQDKNHNIVTNTFINVLKKTKVLDPKNTYTSEYFKSHGLSVD